MKGRRVTYVAAAAVLGAAVATELRKPAEQRTWEGSLGGLVPYDLRPPTPARLFASVWRPEGPWLLPRTFGVGWSVNLWRVREALRS